MLKYWLWHITPGDGPDKSAYRFSKLNCISYHYAWLCQQSYCRGASIRPLTQVSQKLLHGSKPNFVESYLSAISPAFFFSKFLIFKFLRFFFVNIGPYGSQNCKTLLLPHSHPISTKLYDKYNSHGRIQAITLFGDLPKIKNVLALWIFC